MFFDRLLVKGIRLWVESAIFKLKGRYIFHKDEVINLINNKERYSQSQLDEISDIVNISSEQVKKDIFGRELFGGNIEDVSMTKFKKDIAKDINLISWNS